MRAWSYEDKEFARTVLHVELEEPLQFEEGDGLGVFRGLVSAFFIMGAAGCVALALYLLARWL